MNKKVFFELLKINLLSVNPISTKNQYNKYRKKRNKVDNSFYKRLFIFTVIVPMLITTVAYTPYTLLLDYKNMPIYFDTIVIFWTIMGAMFNFVGALEILYGGKDAETLAALPIKSADILYSKVIMIFMSLFPYTLPITVAFAGFTRANGFGLGSGIILALFGFLTASIICFTISLVTVQIVATFTAGTKYKNAISTTVSMIGTLLFVGYILYFSTKANRSINIKNDANGVSIHTSTGPISNLMLNENRIFFLLGIFTISLVVMLIIGAYIKKNYMNVLFKMGDGSKGSKKIGRSKSKGRLSKSSNSRGVQGINSFLFKYNAGLINDSAILTSVITMAILPVMMLGPVSYSTIKGMGGIGAAASQIREMLTPSLIIVIAIAYSILFSLLSSTGLATMIFSLEGFNYEQFLSIPIKRKDIFMSKLVFSTAFSMIIPTIIAIIASIVIKAGPILPILAILFTLIMHIALNFNGLCFDLKNLILDWTNITDLANRTPKWKSILIILISLVLIIVGGVLLMAVFYIFSKLTTVVAFLVYIAIVAGLVIPKLKIYRDYINYNI